GGPAAAPGGRPRLSACRPGAGRRRGDLPLRLATGPAAAGRGRRQLCPPGRIARAAAPAGEDPVAGTRAGALDAAPAGAQRPGRAAAAAAAAVVALAAVGPAAGAGPGLCRHLVVVAGPGPVRRPGALAGNTAAAPVDVRGQRHRHPPRLPAA